MPTCTLAARGHRCGPEKSASLCGRSHKALAEQASPAPTDRECTRACLESGGQYVLVDQTNTVRRIGNQDFAGLQQHAGQSVKLTETLNGGAILVSTIEMPAVPR